MTSSDYPNLGEKQNKEEADDTVSKLIDKWKNMSLDEDSDDDFDPNTDYNKPEYRNKEVFLRRRHRWASKRMMKNFDPLLDVKPVSFDEKNAKVAPEMDLSVLITSPDHWDIGSLMKCEKIEPGHNVSADIVCQWIDDGSTYCLRKRSVPRSKPGEGDSDPGKNQICRCFGGVWTLSPNVFCKTQRWVEGVTTDAESLRFINEKIPSIPTEEVIYDWIDHSWFRWFMLYRRVPGMTLYDAWPQLKYTHRCQVAAEVAKHSRALATFTSNYIETVTGQGPEGRFRLGLRDQLPDWKPRIEPRASMEEYNELMDRAWRQRKNIICPSPGGPFVLQHPNLIPNNIFVTVPGDDGESAKLTAITNWQQLEYFRKWDIATSPRGHWKYTVFNQEDGNDWQFILSNALYEEDFPL